MKAEASDPRAWLLAVDGDGSAPPAEPTSSLDPEPSEAGCREEEHYAAQADETCSTIAKKLGLNVNTIVKLNKDRYPGLRPHAKLLQDTLLILPPPDDAPAQAAAPVSEDKATGKRRRNACDVGNPLGLKQDGKWPIVVGTMMSTPVSTALQLRWGKRAGPGKHCSECTRSSTCPVTSVGGV
jgi:hypothetical protein